MFELPGQCEADFLFERKKEIKREREIEMDKMNRYNPACYFFYCISLVERQTHKYIMFQIDIYLAILLIVEVGNGSSSSS